MCVNMHVGVYICMWCLLTDVYVGVWAEGMSGSLSFSPLSLETLSVPEPGAWLAASNPPASTVSELRLQHWKSHLASDVDAEDLNSGHHVCTTNTLTH